MEKGSVRFREGDFIMQAKIMCNIYGSNRNSLLLKTDFYSLVQCSNCRVIYQVPNINRDVYLKEVIKHYEKINSSEMVASARRRLYNNFFSKINDFHPGKILDIGCGYWIFFINCKRKRVGLLWSRN